MEADEVQPAASPGPPGTLPGLQGMATSGRGSSGSGDVEADLGAGCTQQLLAMFLGCFYR